MSTTPSTVTVASLCWQLGQVQSWQDFQQKVTDVVAEAKEKKADFLLFPELFSIDLMCTINECEMPELWLEVDRHTPAFNDLFATLAEQYQLWIIAGTHVQKHANGKYLNTAGLFGPGGKHHSYSKSHLFGGEKALGEIGGDGLDVFETPFGKVAIQVCYDIQFPEPSRLLARAGADIIFCPAYTVGEQGYWRVRHCSHARAVENSVYVVLANTTGVVERSTIGAGYGQALVTSPSGNAFPPQGLYSVGEVNSEQLLVTELDMDKLREYRQKGETDPINDQRTDLYQISQLTGKE